MSDFTLKKYGEYILAIKNSNIPFYRYDEYMENEMSDQEAFCLVRHDVDRKPHLSLAMAKLEHELGIKSSYYFRLKRASYNEKIIKEIQSLGHEIGYHYECLSDADGNMQEAISDFKVKLTALRKISTVKTCCMHGRPLKPYDNRDIWRDEVNHEVLTKELGLLGELYLDIDYTNITYISDTGRNWNSSKNNRRDKVDSNEGKDFESGDELLAFFSAPSNKRIVFQIHPERWSDNKFEWFSQMVKDRMINFIKKVLR